MLTRTACGESSTSFFQFFESRITTFEEYGLGATAARGESANRRRGRAAAAIGRGMVNIVVGSSQVRRIVTRTNGCNRKQYIVGSAIKRDRPLCVTLEEHRKYVTDTCSRECRLSRERPVLPYMIYKQ